MDGSTPISTRNQLVTRFQTEEDTKVFLLTAKVGGLGLNLTAANYVFLLQPHFNPAVDDQAVERSYRIGQTKEVKIYRIIAGGTIEEKVYNRQLFKKLLQEKVLQNAYSQRKFNEFVKIMSYQRQEKEIIELLQQQQIHENRGLVVSGLNETIKAKIK
uniref:DNA repair and recombination protein Rhp26p n=1 Tax=Trepomonas sp. PC1 TaxID=1076344 RepID=A0A146KGQ7_9EUKA|eukprot:JAP95872.1 DNA repair and recombination protein Rhp26p [Trepomonas sp. PC1]